MLKTCRNCQTSFKITDQDKKFYQKIDVPQPSFCPDCRQQRRLSFRNERYLFKRDCDLCKKEMISVFDADVPFPVYCNKCWWSDSWDQLKYGQDFDFNRPFFDQFQELMMKVPKVGMLQLNNENSDYNALLAYSKNTYMSPGSYFMEDCYYVRKSQYCKDCLNGNFLDHCELVSSSINCKSCYSCSNLINCRNSAESHYLADCFSCQNCFMCSGISNKKWHYKNKQYPETEYKKIVEAELKKDPKKLMAEFQKFNKTVPKKYQNQLNCENSSGDYIQNCKNAIECYDCFDIQDAKYLTESVTVKDSMDLSMHDKDIELCYELMSGGESNYNVKFAFCPCASPNSSYLYSCFYLSDSFGCDSMHSKQSNCILNKKYSKEQYENLKKKIIEHMKLNKEYGEFFPTQLSLYPYNLTIALDYYPLSREEALKKGYKWKDHNPVEYKTATAALPANLQATPDSITKETLVCEKCGKNYRIIAQELQLSKKLNISLSRLCGDCRQIELMSYKNPRKLWERNCDKCGTKIQSTYAPDRPEITATDPDRKTSHNAEEAEEIVYCEKCYLETVS